MAHREEAILAAALASRAEDEDPIDMAVLGGLKNSRASQRLRGAPFPALRSRPQADRGQGQGARWDSISGDQGAPQVILLAANADRVRAQRGPGRERVCRPGFRALGVARTDSQGQWQFLGILPLYDPPREDSKATLDTAKQMGFG